MKGYSDLQVAVGRRGDRERPGRPLVAALPQLGLVVLVTAVGFAASIRWPWVAAVSGSLLAVGLLQAGRAAVGLGRQRRTADEWLLWGAVARPSSALLDWRAGELTSPRLRSTLAWSLRRLEREALGATVPGPVPLNRRAIRAHARLVRALTERLDDRSSPVTARGMVLVDRLLTEPGSPLYSPVADDVLAGVLTDALAAIDPVPAAAAA